MPDIYLTAAFKCTAKEEAYLFMKNEHVKLDYAPGRIDDKILYGPAYNRKFASLRNTIFGDKIDCAFGSSVDGEAYIFAWNNVAKWAYCPSKSSFCDKIIEGPMSIATMFPFLKGTVFENGVDAALESSKQYEAYLFKGDKCAHINYGSNPSLITYTTITDKWPVFRRTVLENGNFDAAFTSHRKNEAYVFQGDSYAYIKFSPGSTDGIIMGGVKKIRDYWSSLATILPRKSASS